MRIHRSDRVSAQAWTDYGILILNTLELYEGRISDRAKYLATILKLYRYAIAAARSRPRT
ncbi:MAG: hypothetical protein SW833_17360 [Cyanobacteriota bacterium]|nr:hypothetical protein [Cyanobacteriota bacterium]